MGQRASVSKVLDVVRELRKTSQMPVVLFTYLNPVYVYGFENFLRDAVEAGADGLLILDLPPEEAAQNAEFIVASGLQPIRLIAPTTPPARMAKIVAGGGGFIYYVSREGVTGEQKDISDTIGEQVAEIRRHTSLPIAVGFGISSPEQAAPWRASLMLSSWAVPSYVASPSMLRRGAGRSDQGFRQSPCAAAHTR